MRATDVTEHRLRKRKPAAAVKPFDRVAAGGRRFLRAGGCGYLLETSQIPEFSPRGIAYST